LTGSTPGPIHLDGIDANAPEVDVVDLRRRVGMVFQNRTVSQIDLRNISYGLRIAGSHKVRALMKRSKSLRGSALWDEVWTGWMRTLGLSGQQQRFASRERSLSNRK
jgi:phosphate transport system ATP-binding protein